MANLKTFDNERYADLIKKQRDKANTLGPNSDDVSESFGKTKTSLLSQTYVSYPILTGGLTSPNYLDHPLSGSIGTRYVQQRLHSYLPSGTSGTSSCQTFMAISSDPASHSPEDIDDVRLKHLISNAYSPNRSDASHEDPNFRGFQLALYPAQSNGGVGNELIADTSNGPIPITADPSAQYGIGDEYWYVDYDDGVVRLSAAPVSGSGYLFNPNDVYADINGVEVNDDAYGAITLFATFYVHDGSVGSDLVDSQFVTIGDGVNSSGTFTGPGSSTFQAAVDFVGANGGDTIWVKDGYYEFNDGYVNVSEDIEIRGLNNVFIKGAEQQALFKILGSNIRIHNISMEIASSVVNPSSAIEISGNENGETIRNILIDKCRILVDGDAYGITFYPEANDLTFENIEILRNVFEDDNSSGWPGINNPSFIGLVEAPIDDNNNSYASTFNNVKIKDNIFKCTQIDGITLVSEFSTVNGLYIDGNTEISGGNARINVRFSQNNNVLLKNNNMPYSFAYIHHGIGGFNSFAYLSGSISIASNTNSPLYVIAGHAIVQTSDDGINWNTGTLANGFSGTIYGVSYGKGLWILTGDSGEIQTSSDGITWTKRTLDNEYAGIIYKVKYGNGIFVGVGSTGEIQTSADGITWTHRNPDNGYSNVFRHIDYNNGLWVAVGHAGEIQTSYDGITWTHRDSDSFSNMFISVSHNLDSWVAVGQNGEIETSYDGITWTSRTADAAYAGIFLSVAHNGKDLWIAVGTGAEIQTSPDGIHWTHQNADASYADIFYDVIYNGKDLWVAVGGPDIGDDGEVQTSPDGVHWTRREGGIGLGGFYGIAAANEIGGAGLIGTSSGYNGSGLVGIGKGNIAHGVVGYGDGYGSGVYGIGGYRGGAGVIGVGGANNGGIGVKGFGGASKAGLFGRGGAGGAGAELYSNGKMYVAISYPGTFLYSFNGYSWIDSGYSFGSTTVACDLAHDQNGLWVAVGASGQIMTSEDGMRWESRNTILGGDDANAVAHNGKDLWVAVGENGKVSTSHDGITWQDQPVLFSGTAVNDVMHNHKNLWVAVGDSGNIATSEDGVNWDERDTILSGNNVIRLGYNGNDLWAAISNLSSVATSHDGISWTTQTVLLHGGAATNRDIDHNGKDLWMVTGSSGYTSTSPDGVHWTTQSIILSANTPTRVKHDGNDTWVAAGNDGFSALSRDGVHWYNTAEVLPGSVFALECLKGPNAGLISYGSENNGSGVIATGRGNRAYGVEAYGDGYGEGVKAIGGSLGAPGLIAFGGGNATFTYAPNTRLNTAPGILAYGAGGSPGIDAYGGNLYDGYGIVARAGLPNGTGIVAYAVGTGTGIVGVGYDGPGIVAMNHGVPPSRGPFRIVPQDTPPSGPNSVGDFYVNLAGKLYICTSAGSPGTWTLVGSQT